MNSTNSKFFNKRNFVAWIYRKFFTMTRKFNPENLNFLGTCFSLVSHSEQFSKNFCSVNSSLLLKQHSFNYSLKLIKLKQVVELTLNMKNIGLKL